LTDFQLFLQGSYTKADMTPVKKAENRLKRTEKSIKILLINTL